MRVCSVADCSLKHYSKGLCKNHYVAEVRLMDKYKGIKRYSNRKLLKNNRLIKLKQANYICEDCGKKSTLVHHIDELTNNHSLNNLKALCSKCHCKYRKPYMYVNKDVELYKLPTQEDLQCILDAIPIISIQDNDYLSNQFYSR